VGLITLPCKRKNVEKPPRNSTGFCGGGQGVSWAVEPRKEERKKERKKDRKKGRKRKKDRRIVIVTKNMEWPRRFLSH
jgi:hypothetical protein